MENRIETSHGVEVPRKSRSLDLKSLYKARVTKDNGNNTLKRKAVADDLGEGSERKKKKKKSVKEVSLSSLKNASSISKKTVDRVSRSGLSSGSLGSKDLKSETNKKLNGGIGFKVVSSFSLSDEFIRVPRRKRDFVGRKKSGGVQVLKPQAESCSKFDDVDQIRRLSVDSGSQVESLKAARKESFDGFKENRKSESNSSKHAEEEDNRVSHVVVSNGDSALNKSRRKRSKTKGLAQDGKVVGDKTEPLVDSSATMSNGDKTEPLVDSSATMSNGDKTEPLGHNAANKSRKLWSKTKKLAQDGKTVVKEAERLLDVSHAVCSNSQEDDEENLEENAAMMLSSRFDPNCTGFSSNNKGSALPTVDGLSFLLSSGRDFVNHGSKSLSESESPSVDAAGRVLRPRKQEEKGNSRKRRHFYEVFFGDLDAFWLLNRRIKVFWPLDQSWYYGLVCDYDKERKLHHVKYDDRDEEWIDLQDERFKLLLLPSEVPGKSQRKRSEARDKIPDQRKRNPKPKTEKEKKGYLIKDESCVGSSYLDTEPIISWLARSSRRVKSPFRDVKKQKTSDVSMKHAPQPLCNDADSFHGHCESGNVRRDKRKVSRNSNWVDRFADDAMKEDSTSESISCPKDGKMPIVYFRRRLRKADLEFSPRCDKNHLRRSKVVPVSSIARGVNRTEVVEKPDVFLGSLGPGWPLWSVDDAGLLKLSLPGSESVKFKFCISFPVLSVLYLYNLFGVETLWLCHSAMLLHCGTVMITLPQVHLEILFVDNIVGLRFLLFEGCLTQALAFVFLIITTFHRPTEQVKFVELQVPVTSIRFKLTCFQHLHKQLLFAFCNYYEVDKTKWVYLDLKLKKHCLLSKQLPLSECTSDNIQILLNKEADSIPTSQGGQPSSIKGMQPRSGQGIGYMGISRSDFADAIHISSSDEMYRKFPSLTLSATTVPSFFLNLHLKLLMDPSLACINFWKPDSVENLKNSGGKATGDCSVTEECLNKGSGITLEENRKRKVLPGDVSVDECFSSCRPELHTSLSVLGDRVHTESSQPCHNGDANVAGTSADPPVSEIKTDGTVQLQASPSRNLESVKSDLSPRTSVDRDKIQSGSESFVNGLSVEIPANQFAKSVDEDLHDVQQPTDLSWSANGGIFASPNPTAPRSTSRRNKQSFPFVSLSHGWSDGKADLVYNGFGNGPKKPRTQVSYSLPVGGFDFNPKQKSIQKGLPPKRIRKASSVKRSSDVSRSSQKNLESLSCAVNILVTAGDRGWREYGAKVVLELFDHNEWRLAVKVSGSTKYTYKAHQFLQPGSTNRYTHAMMWKGGKDWALEFFDRSQWALFKEMHEECHNRNARAASVKNIPIPGVRVVEEGDDNGMETSFFRSSSKYIRQLESDIEMALNPSHVLYEMDSDDERWIQNAQNLSDSHSSSLGKISEEMFEKTMDMFEKGAYVHQRDQLSSEEIEELMVGVGPLDIIKAIYEHWRQKRLKNGMPLVRHLQSPSWERYQQQLLEWEQNVSKMNTGLTNGFQDKSTSIEKPPMFAFCMKPRGLEVPNKGSKQRSHRKVSLSGHHSNYAFAYGDQDGYHNYGRRLSGLSYGDEKFVYSGHSYDSLDDSPLHQSSPRIPSPLNRSHSRKLHRSKSRRYETAISPGVPHGLYSHRRMTGNRNRLHRWNAGFSEWPSQRHHFQPPEASRRQLIEQHFEGPDLDEFRLRDASGAAKNALNTAKLKRNRAQRLAYRADLAIHKAVAALMTAEAAKNCLAGSNGDG